MGLAPTTALVAVAIALTLCVAQAEQTERPKAAVRPHDRPETSDEFPSAVLRTGDEVVGTVSLSYDAKHLYLRYSIRDKTPLKNSGDDWRMLFKTGDSVDLQLGLDPNADPDRTTPAVGDIRVLMTKTKDGPIAVAYRYRVPGTNDPVSLGSPLRTVKVDLVEKLKDLKVTVHVDDEAYTLDAEIPWSVLAGKPFQPKAGTILLGDVGVLFSDPDGAATVERIYWSNKHTSVVADVPSEIELLPKTWGEFQLE